MIEEPPKDCHKKQLVIRYQYDVITILTEYQSIIPQGRSGIVGFEETGN